MNSALRKGQSEIEASCTAPELIEAARKSVQTALVPLVSATGWKVGLICR